MLKQFEEGAYNTELVLFDALGNETRFQQNLNYLLLRAMVLLQDLISNLK